VEEEILVDQRAFTRGLTRSQTVSAPHRIPLKTIPEHTKAMSADLVHDRRHRLRNRPIRGRSVNTIPHTVYHAAQCALDRLTDYIRRKQAQPPPPTPPQVIPESIQRRKKSSTIKYARERWSFAGIEIRKLTQPIRIGQIRGHGAGASTTLKQENSE
jgi:hypothetical protein